MENFYFPLQVFYALILKPYSLNNNTVILR